MCKIVQGTISCIWEGETVLAQIMYRSHLHSLIEIIFSDLRDGNCSFSLSI